MTSSGKTENPVESSDTRESLTMYRAGSPGTVRSYVESILAQINLHIFSPNSGVKQRLRVQLIEAVGRDLLLVARKR